MDDQLLTWMWLLGGLVLALGELAIPGMVVVFLGSAAMLVGLLRYLGVVESLGVSLAVWMAGSVGLLLGVRRSVMRFFPSSSQYNPHRPDLDALGQLVEVLEDVPAEGKPGRIRYEGTTWDALSEGEPIKAGSKARLVLRDNLVWRVEPLRADELEEAEQALLPPGDKPH
jgi:membrane protein implicated in regulation of membrane protease activity